MTDTRQKDMKSDNLTIIKTADLSKDDIARLMKTIAKSPATDKRSEMINAYNALIKPKHKNS